MSEALDTTVEEGPARGRMPRAEAQAGHRRRRDAGSLNRMQRFKLDIFSPEDLDLENYYYYWTNDEGTNLRQMTKLDDYDFVSTAELGDGFDVENTDSESTERVRMLVGNKADGSPLYAYLLKKLRSYWEEDNERAVRNHEDKMAGRVHRNEGGFTDPLSGASEQRPGGEDIFYASKSNQIGHAAQRRRGPVPRTLK